VDLEALLEQTQGTGVNVYTHGEMLPAHGYPGLKKYSHLAGHFGGPWNLQQMEWRSFPGPIVVTTNCIMRPQRAYSERLFTMNEVGWPGTKRVTGRDFSDVIAIAQDMDGYSQTMPGKTSITGFGHNAVLGAAPTLLKAIEAGDLKKLVLIGGCDGYEAERSWFTEFAQALPQEAAILTLGCGKFRVINKVEDSFIPNTEIPRVLDMGQCNDSYSAVAVAVELAKVLNCGVNDLPLSINLSWLEQKAVAVLLSLLHLGIKGIRLGPSAPAFVTPAIFEVLQTNYDLKLVNQSTAAADAEEVMRA
jgi:hydroxylamine reductase